MCKQRSAELAITAVEIDDNAYAQALQNIANSPWPTIDIKHQTIQSFNSKTLFDLVISNPPYFSQSLKSGNAARNTARHTDSLSFEELINAFKQLSHKKSRFSLILPTVEATLFIELATHNGLYLNRHCQVKTTPNKPFSRSLMTFSYVKRDVSHSTLCIKDFEHSDSEDYIVLCRAFYLKM
jgi:tRNA1Val (adenine37-N6)-methyltransferase